MDCMFDSLAWLIASFYDRIAEWLLQSEKETYKLFTLEKVLAFKHFYPNE